MQSPPFFVADVEMYAPPDGPVVVQVDEGFGTHPFGTLAQDNQLGPVPEMLRASDVGYRTKSTDPGGLLVYEPIVSDAFQINRKLYLDPNQSSVAFGWGSLQLTNADGRFNTIAGTRNTDGRSVTIRWGRKAWDNSRGLYLDPSVSDLLLAFAGVAQPWTLDETTLSIPLRDATYWIERPVQSRIYAGTGALEGGSDLSGKPKPMARGGTASNPICNVTPVLVDSVHLIYQYTDGPGTVVNLYEGGYNGAGGITYAGDVPDLYVGSTPPGQYRTCNALGLFQLGSPNVSPITVDITGSFIHAGAQTTAMSIVRYLLTEDMQLSDVYLDLDALTTLDAAFPYTSGVWFGTDQVQGAAAIDPLFTSIAACFLPSRNGTLSAVALRVPDAANSAGTFDTTNLVSLVPQQLDTAVDPPPFRWQVGYQKNYTVQTNSLNSQVTSDRLQFLAADYRYAGWASNSVQLAYVRPNNPSPVQGALLKQADAKAVAEVLGALWGVRRRLYLATLPLEIGLQYDIGETVMIKYPMDNLSGGQPGIIVGDQMTSQDSTISYLVLV